MKMKKMKTMCLALIGAAMILTSCTKTGPAGPAGAAGTNGNANVQETTFYSQGFSYVAANNDYEVNLSVPGITQAVLDKGAILVYLQASSSTSGWVQLPASIGSVQFNVANYVGSVQVTSSNASSGLLNFKVVVIPQ